tara:strand:+ start:648 stop:794 length:147 start_codon:yes stop_codon:yes gene_type:complete
MKSENIIWEEPKIKDLGKAKDLIKNLNPIYDAKNSEIDEDQYNVSVQS